MNAEKVKHLQKARWNSDAEYCQAKRAYGTDSEEAEAAKVNVIAITKMIEREYEEELESILIDFSAESKAHGECIFMYDADLCLHEDYMDICVTIVPLHINFDKLQGCNEDDIKELERLNRADTFSKECQRIRKEVVWRAPTGADWCPIRCVCLYDQKLGEQINVKELLGKLGTEAKKNKITIELT